MSFANTSSSTEWYLIEGCVCSGRGRASEHMKHADDVLAQVGENIVPGSLNLVLEHPIILNENDALKFDNGKRILLPVVFFDMKAWGYRWHGARPHVLEIASGCRLREQYHLSDGDTVNVYIKREFVQELGALGKLVHFAIWKWRGEWYYSKKWYHCWTSKWLVKYLERISGALQ